MARGSASDSVLSPLVVGWLEKINLASEARKGFMDVAQQCHAFFQGAVGFMWDAPYKNKFLAGTASPKFKMTMNKAFELVALYGPTLYWRNPKRAVRPRERLKLSSQSFGNDPMSQMIFQQAQMSEQAMQAENMTRADLLEKYLNYTPDEQPMGGLERHSRLAITEALVKGRGCLWVEPYFMPGSSRVLTGCFWDTVENLFIDPDARTLDDARWIGRKHVVPTFIAERTFGLKPGSIKEAGGLESAYARGERRAHKDGDDEYRRGKTFDLITYYEIFSKGGVGSRMTGMSHGLSNALEKQVGDYAYIVVSPTVDYPLNAPPKSLVTDSDEQAVKRFQWPAPYWRDDRWPVAMLDFYENPNSAWPIAPLAPGLGELIFLNFMISHLSNRIVNSSRDFIACIASAQKEVEAALNRGSDLTVIPLQRIHKNINEVVQFLQQPQVNFDAWRIIDRVLDIFNQRVGLTELMYGAAETQSRSAEDIATRREFMSVRPDFMATKVEKWQSEAGRMEKMCARWFIEPEHVQPILGQVGAYLWNRLVTSQDPEMTVREVDVTVEAGSIRKPNKEREASQIQQLLPVLTPELSKHADATHDTRPLNAWLARIADTIEMDMNGLQMGPRVPMPPPPPPPEVLQQQQQQMQMQMQMQQQQHQMKMAAEQAKLQSLQIRAQADQQKAQTNMMVAQYDAQAAQRQAALDAQAQQSQMAFEQQKLQMEQQAMLTKMSLDAREGQQKLQMDAMFSQQEMAQDQERHEQEMEQQRQKFMLSLAMPQQAGESDERRGSNAAA